MSIRDRLKDAKLLADGEHCDGALLSVMVAIAATSRRRYPSDNVQQDKDAITKFLIDEMLVIFAGGDTNFIAGTPRGDPDAWPGRLMPLQEILYEFVRGNLAHGATLPAKVEFVDAEQDFFVIDIDDTRIRLARSIFERLSEVVIFAPENADLFPRAAETPPDIIAQQCFGVLHKSTVVLEYMERRTERVSKLNKSKH
jgi:hypothetical protein